MLPSEDLVLLGDNMDVLPRFADGCFQLIYADPPFNTGRRQERLTLATEARTDGDRTGFGGRRYATEVLARSSFADSFEDYLGFLEPRLRELHRLLGAEGTLYLHLDYREAHYAKVLLDGIFGRECFLNEIVWAYDYGARPRRRWPAKHDTILVYVKDPDRYWFDAEAVEREPYMAPGLVTAEKAERGKLPTDVWWHTIVSPTGKEKTGYPTQKPEGVLRRIVQASSRPRRLVPRPVRRVGDAGVGLRSARTPLRSRRLELRGGRSGPQASRAVLSARAAGTCRSGSRAGSDRQAVGFSTICSGTFRA